MTDYAELAALGVATVHEAAGRTGVVDLPLTRVVPGSRVAGPARTALCAPGDNTMVHALVAHARPGDVLVLTSAEPAPVAFVGDLLATQAQAQGVAGILVDGAVRDLDELAELGLPIWTRFVRAQGATKGDVGKLDVPVVVGGVEIRPGDLVVMDCDGAVVVPADRVEEMLPAARERADRRPRFGSATGTATSRTTCRACARSSKADRGLMEVAVLGLGEAGGRIAADLAAAGCAVRGWDPSLGRPASPVAADGASAVRDAEVVLSINAAAVALEVAKRSRARSAATRSTRTATPRRPRSSTRSRRACRAASPTSRSSARCRALGSEHRRWPRARAQGGSPRSSDRSGCRSRWSALVRATRRA